MTEKRFDVSLYLIKSSQTAIAESALLPPSAPILSLINEIPGGKFLALHSDANLPKWVTPVQTLLATGNTINHLTSQTSGGLLWITRNNKSFVFTFGHAHAKLNDDWLEPEFGKRVALNVIPQKQIIEMRAEQVFAKWHIASERAPRASAVHEFGFEADRDLVAAVEGIPSKHYLQLLGSKLRGGTALKFGMYFSKINQTLDEISERFDSADYKTIWPQIDNLVTVRDSTQIQALDNLLNNTLIGAQPGNSISLAAPAQRSGDKPYPQHFVLGRQGRNSVVYPHLAFSSWQSHLGRKGKSPSLATSLDTTVHLLDEDSKVFDSCTMYQCFGTEVSQNGRPFVLSSGVWYEAKLDFVNETNRVINQLASALPPHLIPNWNQVDLEGPYNEKAVQQDSSLMLFDKDLVTWGGGHSKFEFCDLMHLGSKTLYFVKRPSSSASLSHLSEQVRRTAENFFSIDDSFRQELANKLTKRNSQHNVSWLQKRPQRREWNLCLVSMGKAANQFPFFAKCGMARLVREMQQGDYNLFFQAV